MQAIFDPVGFLWRILAAGRRHHCSWKSAPFPFSGRERILWAAKSSKSDRVWSNSCNYATAFLTFSQLPLERAKSVGCTAKANIKCYNICKFIKLKSCHSCKRTATDNCRACPALRIITWNIQYFFQQFSWTAPDNWWEIGGTATQVFSSSFFDHTHTRTQHK